MIKGSKRVPNKIIPAKKTTVFRIAISNEIQPSEGSFNIGSNTISGTTAKSCTINIPTMTLLESVPSQP